MNFSPSLPTLFGFVKPVLRSVPAYVLFSFTVAIPSGAAARLEKAEETTAEGGDGRSGIRNGVFAGVL